jgi:hypothetical protein
MHNNGVALFGSLGVKRFLYTKRPQMLMLEICPQGAAQGRAVALHGGNIEIKR